MALENRRQSDHPFQPAAEPIAIIGLSCRFPGAPNADAFWRLLCGGGDAITEVPRDRWDVDAFYDADLATAGKMNSRWGGFIKGVDQFDAHFFGISPGEAASMDPQHRLLLEVAWEALEHAGIVPAQLAGSSTGVFVGIGTNEYASVGFDDFNHLNAYFVTGNALSIAVNRLSYLLDLRGPSLALDTGCSSSLLAVHMACQSLRLGESSVALAGGVNLILSPKANIGLSQAWMMAADGRCKSFDARADGYVRGEGCGLVVLKRLHDATADGDPILAVIRGSATNQNGRGEALTAPNAQAQQAVMRQAMIAAGVTPDQVDLIEAHGVGTPLADVVEAQALTAIFGPQRCPDRPCMLGSVKTNIGHLEMAAGIASLIKVVLALHHQAIPPHIHLKTLNPKTGLHDAPFILPSELCPWPRGERQRLCGVNSFGLGGVNAHMIVSEAPASSFTQIEEPHDGLPRVLPLSAKSNRALHALADCYVTFLQSPDAASFAAVCAAASTTRTHFNHRLAVIAPDAATAVTRLQRWLDGTADPEVYQAEAGDLGPAAQPVSAADQPDHAALARLYVQGAALDWQSFTEDVTRPRVRLPTYPFQRKRYWIETAQHDQHQQDDPERLPEQPALAQQLMDAPHRQRRDLLALTVQRIVVEVLGLDEDMPVDPEQSLFDLGMTSLMAVNLQHRLQQSLGETHKLPLMLLFEYASIAALSDHLAHTMFEIDEPAHHAEAGPLLIMNDPATPHYE